MMAEKNSKTGLFCNRASPLYSLSQQVYANFLHNQRLNKAASPGILEGRVNETDVPNTNIISWKKLIHSDGAWMFTCFPFIAPK